jgi:phage FluMu gp28-like protein
MRDSARFRAVNKSKKTGISTTFAGESIHKTFTNSGRQVMFVSTGQRIAEELLGKWYDMVNTMPPALRPAQWKKQSAEAAALMNGSRVMSLPSSDPGKIRGLGLRGSSTDVYLDEYAHADKDEDLWVVVRDFQIMGGRITINSTPKGKRGKYYKIIDPLQTIYRGKAPSDPKQVWSYHEIPFWHCERLRNQEAYLKAGTTDIDFKQEYCCEFIDESLSFYPYEIIWQCQTVKSWVDTGYKTNNTVIMGIDFGKSVSETIVYVSEKTGPMNWKTLYIEELPGVNYESQVETIVMLFRAYRPTIVNIDGTGPGGQTMYDYLSKENRIGNSCVSYNLSSAVKENILIRLRVLLQAKRFALPAHKETSGEFSRIAEKLETQLHGMMRTTTDAGLHTRYSGKETVGMDDMVFACALSVYEEYEYNFDPMIVEVKDSTLARLTRERDMDETQIEEYGIEGPPQW